MDETERCLLRRAVSQRDVSVRERLKEGVQFFLMFRDIVSRAGKDGFVYPLGLVVCLWMLRRGR